MAATYARKQRSLFCLLPYAVAITFGVTSFMLANVGETPTAAFFLVVSLLQGVVGLSFQHLIIRDDANALIVRFGPLPLFQTRLDYSAIRKIERSQIGITYGMHRKDYSWQAWRKRLVWSLGDRECVVIHRDADVVRIATFLESKMVERSSV